MADRNPTKHSRIAAGDHRDETGASAVSNYGDMVNSVRMVLSKVTSTPQKHVIRGEFEMLRGNVTVVGTAPNASAKTVNIGTDATGARFAAVTVSAGSENEIFAITPGSAAMPDWMSTGSAAATTTVAVVYTDTSGLHADDTSITYVTIDYAVRA
jgi:hypothetical protein